MPFFRGFLRAVLGAFPAALSFGLLLSATFAAHAGATTQTITFNNPGAQDFGTTPTLTASSSSGLTVSFTSNTPGFCTVTSGGALTFVATGTCTINADQAGDATYDAATTVSQTFAINAVAPGAPTIGTAAPNGSGSVQVYFTAPASTGGAAILSYSVTTSYGVHGGTGASSPITVSGLTNGMNYAFFVTAKNSAGFTGPASSLSNYVRPQGSQSITFTNPGAQNFGTTPTLMATASSGLTVSFTSTTTAVCTVTSGGALTFLAAGTCTINANQAGDSAWAAATQVVQSFAVNAVIPGVPTGVSATAGNAQASVAFTAPANTGGATITGYTVTSSPGGISASGASSPVVVTGLTNGVSYTFSVRATNSGGTGTGSVASNAVTPHDGSPVASAVSATVAYGSSANPITLSISGVATGVAVVGAASHGAAIASGTSISYTPTAGYSGPDSFTYTASNASGTSSAATVTVLVQTRPDPAKDAEVSGLLNAQAQSASRFALAQVGNFQSHLESLHQGARRRRAETSAGAAGDTSDPTANASTNSADDTRILGRASSSAASTTRQTGGAGSVYGAAGGASFGSGLDGFVLPQKSSATGSDAPPFFSSVNLAGQHGDLLNNGLEVWTGGVVSLGKQSDTDTRFTTSGISLGADRRLGDELTVGIGAGFGHERQTIGDNGTRNFGDSYSAVVYASYQPGEGVFFDGLIGYGTLDFDARRYVSAQDATAALSRSGTQWFSSFSGGYDYLDGKLLLSTYSRLDLGSSRLQRATETGGGIYNLSYFEQTISTTTLSLGVRGETEIELSGGVARPYCRVEYQHNFVTPDAARMAYADELYTVYQLDIDGVDRDTLVLALGGDLLLKKDLALGLGYRYSQGSESTRIHTLGFHLKKTF